MTPESVIRGSPYLMLRARTGQAGDGSTRGGPLSAAHRPITADETLPTEQLVQQLASCKCNDSNVRTAINTNNSGGKKIKKCASLRLKGAS